MTKQLIPNKFNIANLLEEKRSLGMLRNCPTVNKISSRKISVAGKDYINFASNDYLGLTANNKLLEALHEGIELYGAGTGASALVTGYTQAHEALADKLSKLTGKKGVLLFNSGFAANQALIKAFIDLKSDLILDKLVHASMQDAASRTTNFHRYPHQDLAKAHSLITKYPNSTLFTEGVFSMDGDTADLTSLNHICSSEGIPLVLDDAHGFGVL